MAVWTAPTALLARRASADPRRGRRGRTMTNAAALREQAARTREHAREYRLDVARPLIERARALEWEAAMLEREGRERRLRRLTGRERALFPARPIFGRKA
jgi:hypothetical protein